MIGLLKYWKLAASVFLIAGVFLFGYKVASTECQLEKARLERKLLEEVEKQEKIIEDKAIEYYKLETELSKNERQLREQLNANNYSAGACPIPNEWVRIINKAG